MPLVYFFIITRGTPIFGAYSASARGLIIQGGARSWNLADEGPKNVADARVPWAVGPRRPGSNGGASAGARRNGYPCERASNYQSHTVLETAQTGSVLG